MLKDDWIMKIVAQFGKVYAHILGKVDDGDTQGAQELIGDNLSEYIGLTSPQIETMSEHDLINSIGAGGIEGQGRLIMVTELLRAEGYVRKAENDEEGAVQRWIKVLNIRIHMAIGHDMMNAHLDATVDALIEELKEYQLPTQTVTELFNYYEKTGQFDLAEDTLYELIDNHITNNNMVEEGLAFYERLLRKSDSELQAGSLPRDEVQAGFDELWERE